MGAQWTSLRPIAVVALFAATLSACGGSGDGDSGGTTSYSINGVVSGLTAGESVILGNNGGNAITVNGNTSFSFPSLSGSNYSVTVLTQPKSETCTISNGNGTVSGANVSGIRVTCQSTYSVPVTVNGLASGARLILLNNDSDELIITSNGTFEFPTKLSFATAYDVSIKSQPNGQSCVVNYEIDIVPKADSNPSPIIECTTEVIVWNFGNGNDGASPRSVPILGPDGAFYGTTLQGGTYGTGTVYRITPDGKESTLWNFGAANDGRYPYGGLVMDDQGDFYGTTFNGGSNGEGTVFKLTANGVETVLWDFGSNTNDGLNPYAGVIIATDGNLYGTTQNGGSAGYGTVFSLTPNGVETVLWNFWVTPGDAQSPMAGLIQASDGNFYGTTTSGGYADYGTVFSITPSGNERVVWSFIPSSGVPSDGVAPDAPLVEDADGWLWGTTFLGGEWGTPQRVNNSGSVFRLSKSGDQENVWVRFGRSGSADGVSPQAAVMFGRDGNIYGTTSRGGNNDLGTVFKVAPAGQETVIWSFGAGSDGTIPFASLIQASDGSLYGVTATGGAYGGGVLFKLSQ